MNTETLSRGFAFNMLLAAIKMMMSSTDWDKIKLAVDELDSSEISGTEKRELAIKKAREVISKIPDWLLNLAIEIAVARLRKT